MVLACNTRVACVSLVCSTHIACVFHACTYYLVAGKYGTAQTQRRTLARVALE